MEYSAYPNPTYDLKHQITLKDKTKLIFGTDSYLRRIIDTNGNTIQFQYGPRSDGNFLGYITDAVGNRIIMTYTSDYSKLTKITDESTGRVTSFQYDSAKQFDLDYSQRRRQSNLWLQFETFELRVGSYRLWNELLLSLRYLPRK